MVLGFRGIYEKKKGQKFSLKKNVLKCSPCSIMYVYINKKTTIYMRR